MSMNLIIQQKRKELGLTQEQVADYLGVSTPAVSKWETGITTPDIGTLPALARLLNTDLNTLFSFNETLTPEEIGAFCNELAFLAKRDLAAAFDAAGAKLHEFPHHEPLLLNISMLLDSMVPPNTPNPFEAKISDWYLRLSRSADDSIRNSANYMRASRYIRQNKLDATQSVLDQLQDKAEITHTIPDKLMLTVSLYLKQNKADLAALELEKELLRSVTRVQLILTKLVDAELAAGETASAAQIAEKVQKLADLFDLWQYSGYTALYQVVSHERNAEKALPLLEQMLEALTLPWQPTESVLYRRMAPSVKAPQTKEYLSLILKELETDPGCEYLRTHPDYHTLIDPYTA